MLLGRSFGGMIVTHYADVLPQDVVGVVVLDTPAPSAEFTEKSEPGLVWDAPGNTEHLDVVHGFENRFANHPPHFDAPLLVITPVPGEGSVKNESFWLQTSPQAKQVQLVLRRGTHRGPLRHQGRRLRPAPRPEHLGGPGPPLRFSGGRRSFWSVVWSFCTGC